MIIDITESKKTKSDRVGFFVYERIGIELIKPALDGQCDYIRKKEDLLIGDDVLVPVIGGGHTWAKINGEPNHLWAESDKFIYALEFNEVENVWLSVSSMSKSIIAKVEFHEN